MKYYKTILFVVCYLAIPLYVGAKRKAQGKLKYEMNWINGITPCETFINKVVDVSGVGIKKDSPTSTALNGEFKLMRPIVENTAILILVDKETPQGKILAYTIEIPNLCNHIKEEGMPWSIFIDAMNLNPRSCPIPAKVYTANDLKLNMSFTEKALNHETVGEYMAQIEFRHKGEGLDVIEHDIACYKLGFTVDEIREKSDDKSEDE